jgi:hypothetical protein
MDRHLRTKHKYERVGELALTQHLYSNGIYETPEGKECSFKECVWDKELFCLSYMHDAPEHKEEDKFFRPDVLYNALKNQDLSQESKELEITVNQNFHEK